MNTNNLIQLKIIRSGAAALAVGLGAISAGVLPAKAEPAAVGVTATCPLTGPGVGACVVVGTLLHEFVQAANGNEAFGPNGEIMKILSAPVKTFEANAKGVERESGDLDKAVRFVTGISIKDIHEYGLFGGPNSFLRKPFG